MRGILPWSRLRGCWDYPQEPAVDSIGTYVSRDRRLALFGWVLADETPSITVRVDGSDTVTLAPTCYREDIDIIFSHSYPTAAGASAWAVAIDVSALDEGPHRIEVVARAGSERLTLGSRAFRLTPPHEDSAASLRRIEPLLRGAPLRTRDHQIFFTEPQGSWTEHPTSAFGYSGNARQIVSTPGATSLVVGAGLTPTVDGVVQLDIFDYPNIDVVSFAPELPFKDEAFDAVVCENVIEHVPDPFQLVREIARVLKPGGQIGINGTNMHFTHGFPSHFFNPTEFGMRYLLEERESFTGEYQFVGVQASLWTVLGYYLNALEPDARAQIERMSVGRMFAALTPGSRNARASELLTRLSPKAQKALSSNVYFIGRKNG
jgi:SAM-dependent methyltransferase